MKDFLIMVLPVPILIGLGVFIWASVQRRRHPPSQEMIEAARLFFDRRWMSSGWAAITFEVIYLGVYSIIRFTVLSPTLRTALVFVPVLVFIWFMVSFYLERRNGDEMTRQVQLDAVFTASAMFIVWSMGMWVMDALDPTPHSPHNTFSAALGFLPLMYWIGLFNAKAKYLPNPRSKDAKP